MSLIGSALNLARDRMRKRATTESPVAQLREAEKIRDKRIKDFASTMPKSGLAALNASGDAGAKAYGLSMVNTMETGGFKDFGKGASAGGLSSVESEKANTDQQIRLEKAKTEEERKRNANREFWRPNTDTAQGGIGR